ncbi:hypothetical protein LWI28_015203 [Acer negundo]|uniref:Secreted protein n=1 Tax=Acer negundo TaxID=4023 RepID=A0AAD5NHD6_ACENE|nr:hypothetical protein LWI28_015203 [Acer negundo]
MVVNCVPCLFTFVVTTVNVVGGFDRKGTTSPAHLAVGRRQVVTRTSGKPVDVQPTAPSSSQTNIVREAVAYRRATALANPTTHDAIARSSGERCGLATDDG